MFTNNKAKYYGDNKVLIDAACLKTDSKPTTGIANGSKCIEMDTGKTYMFNEEDSEWEELPSSGGGGGSSDLIIVTMTMVDEAGIGAEMYGAFVNNDPQYTMESYGRVYSGSADFTLVMYKGQAEVAIKDGDFYIIACTGDATVDGSGIITVTGDCTVTITERYPG